MDNKTLSTSEKALLMHKEWNGKLETTAKYGWFEVVLIAALTL